MISTKENWTRYYQQLNFWELHGYEITDEMIRELAEECNLPQE